MRISAIGYYFLLLILWSFSSCSTTKFVPEGEYLLDKVHIKTDNAEFKSPDLQQYVRQRPNYKMFALNKSQLQIYSLSGRDSTKWLNKLVRRLGEPPVILDSTLIYKTETELSKLFVNKGYVHVDVGSEILRKGKKAEVVYTIKTNEPYRIRSFSGIIQDTAVYSTLYEDRQPSRRWTGESNSSYTSLIKPGNLFDRFVLDEERQRLVNLLRNRGYYAFSKNYIGYNADTTLMSNSVDLEMVLYPYRNYLSEDKYEEVPHKRYYIDQVYIYIGYDPLVHSGIQSYVASDSVRSGNYTVYYPEAGKTVRPKVLLDNCFIFPGFQYSAKREELTYYAYSSLEALENVNIRFQEKTRNDSTYLDCYILSSTAKKQNVSFSVEGTNSQGNLGFASSVGYQHRNIFRGSETFGIKLTGAYESIAENFSDNYIDIDAQVSLNVPKFIFPFLSGSLKRRLRASTEFTLSYNYLTRPEFNRILLSGGLKYIWQDRIRRLSRHQFSLLDVNYVYLPRVDKEFLGNLPPNAALFSYTNQFIVGMGYAYSYSTFNPSVKYRNAHSFRVSAESAGNALYALSSAFGAQKGENGSYELFDIHYAQFVKGDIDYSRTTFVDKKNSFAWHIGAGVAYPYSNSTILPFEKRYYAGGANGVRGWSVRSLGPGTYRAVPGKTTFYEQSGDIRLDLNLEYRSHLFWKLELASYIDAGNIWTIRPYEGQEGGFFKVKEFYKEIALSYGLGIRLDFDFFLLRLDTGMKAYDPSRSGSDKWVIRRPNFRDKFAWHFAVGYPF